MNYSYQYKGFYGHQIQYWDGSLDLNGFKSFPTLAERTGTGNYLWEQRLAAGEQVYSPYTRRAPRAGLQASFEVTFYDVTSRKWRTVVVHAYPNVYLAAHVAPNRRASVLAWDNFVSAFRESITEWESLTSLVEAPQTGKAVKDLIGSIATARKRLQHGHTLVDQARYRLGRSKRLYESRLRQATTLAQRATVKRDWLTRKSRIRKAFEGSWLTYALSIRPLVLDIQSATEEFERSIPTEPLVVKGYAPAYDAPVVGFHQFEVAGRTFRCPYAIKKKTSVTYTLYMTPELLSKVPRYGLDSTGLALAAWEIVPWSFVIDYFTNVDNFIQGKMLWSLIPNDIVLSEKVKAVQTPTGQYFVYLGPKKDITWEPIPSKWSDENSYTVFNRSRVPKPQPRLIMTKSLAELHPSQQVTLTALASTLTGKVKALRKLF